MMRGDRLNLAIPVSSVPHTLERHKINIVALTAVGPGHPLLV